MNAAMMTEIDDPARMREREAICRYVLAGNATFTLVSKKTGARFTFRVRTKTGEEGIRFVSLLTGQNNESDYQFLGTIFLGDRAVFAHGKRSSISKDAPSALAWRWFFGRAFIFGGDLSALEFWHSGRCGRCARKLTVPESVASGLGPECAGRS